MKNKLVVWFGLVFVLSVLIAVRSGATPTPQTEGPKSTESVVTEEPKSAKSLLTGEIVQDFTLPDGNGNMVSLAAALQENEQVVLVFYYRRNCTPCMAQLSEIENDRARYEEKSAQLIAIAVQDELYASASAKVSNVQFPVLADKDHAVAEAFGVYETPEYEGLTGLSTPSVFIINKERQIVWGQISHIEGGCGENRIPSQTILENLG